MTSPPCFESPWPVGLEAAADRAAGRGRDPVLRQAGRRLDLGRERGVLRRDAARDDRKRRLHQPLLQLRAAIQQAGPELLDRGRRCTSVFGVSVGVERLAIAAAAMVMLIAVWFIARAASMRPLAPLLAALGLAAGPRFFMFSRRIFVDMAVTAMMTLTLLFFVLAERYPSRRRLFLALMYVSVGLGVLTKGPVAAVIPFLVFVVYLAVAPRAWPPARHDDPARARSSRWRSPRPGMSRCTSSTAGPTSPSSSSARTSAASPRRSASRREVRSSTCRCCRATRFPGRCACPAVVWAVASRSAEPDHARRRRASLRIRTLLLLWIAMIVVFFSLSQTKQDLYIFPIVAAVAALGGDWVARALVRLKPDAAKAMVHQPRLTVIGVVMVALGGAVLYLFGGERPLRPIRRRPGGGDGGHGRRCSRGDAAVAAPARAAVCAVLVVLIAFNWILAVRALPDFEQYKPVVPLSRDHRTRAGPGDVVAHVRAWRCRAWSITFAGISTSISIRDAVDGAAPIGSARVRGAAGRSLRRVKGRVRRGDVHHRTPADRPTIQLRALLERWSRHPRFSSSPTDVRRRTVRLRAFRASAFAKATADRSADRPAAKKRRAICAAAATKSSSARAIATAIRCARCCAAPAVWSGRIRGRRPRT